MNKKKGVALAIIAALFYSLISVCVKWIGGVLPTVEILLFRGLVMWIVGCSTMLVQRQKLDNRKLPLLMARGLSGAFGALTYYAAVASIPLAETMALVNLSPFVISVLAAIFLKEKIHRWHVIALLISFAGALVIIRPGFSTVQVGYLIALASAFITGCSYTMVRKLKQDVDTQTIVFWYNAMTVAVALPVTLLKGFVMPQGLVWVKLLCLGLCSLLFNYFNTASYQYASAGEISIYTYLSIIFSSLIGIFLWKEHLVLSTVIGIVLILAGAYCSFVAKKPTGEKAVEGTKADGAFGAKKEDP